MVDELNNWISEAIKSQQDKIDTAISRCWNDVRYRSEGYLEALFHIQQLINQETNEIRKEEQIILS